MNQYRVQQSQWKIDDDDGLLGTSAMGVKLTQRVVNLDKDDDGSDEETGSRTNSSMLTSPNAYGVGDGSTRRSAASSPNASVQISAHRQSPPRSTLSPEGRDENTKPHEGWATIKMAVQAETQHQRLMSPKDGSMSPTSPATGGTDSGSPTAEALNSRHLFYDLNRVKKLVKRSKYVIHPECMFRRVWDVIQIITLLYVAITIPIRVGLEVPSVNGWYMIDVLIDVYFILDVVVNFFTGYENPEEPETYIMDQQKVVRHYLKTWFVFDLIASVPAERIYNLSDNTFVCSIIADCDEYSPMEGQMFRLVKVLRLVKLIRLFHFGKLLHRLQDGDLFHVVYYLQLARQLLVMIFIGHVSGCVFYYFSAKTFRTPDENDRALTGPPPNRTDLRGGPILVQWQNTYFGDDPNGSQGIARYIAALYWSFQTFTTTGFGDIPGVTISERVCAIIGMVLGGFYFSFLIGAMSGILNALNRRKIQQEERMNKAHAFLSDEKVPVRLRLPLMSFYRRQRPRGANTMAILMQLSFDLRLQVIDHIFRELLAHCLLFRGCSDAFISAILMQLEICHYARGEVVIQRGDVGTYLYFVLRGQLEVSDSTGVSVIGVMRHGAYFGEGVLLGEPVRVETVRAASYCSLYYIHFQRFAAQLDHAPHLLNLMAAVWEKRKASLKVAGEDDEETRKRNRRPSLAQRTQNPWCTEYLTNFREKFQRFIKPADADPFTTQQSFSFGTQAGRAASMTFQSFRTKSQSFQPSSSTPKFLLKLPAPAAAVRRMSALEGAQAFRSYSRQELLGHPDTDSVTHDDDDVQLESESDSDDESTVDGAQSERGSVKAGGSPKGKEKKDEFPSSPAIFNNRLSPRWSPRATLAGGEISFSPVQSIRLSSSPKGAASARSLLLTRFVAASASKDGFAKALDSPKSPKAASAPSLSHINVDATLQSASAALAANGNTKSSRSHTSGIVFVSNTSELTEVTDAVKPLTPSPKHAASPPTATGPSQSQSHPQSPSSSIGDKAFSSASLEVPTAKPPIASTAPQEHLPYECPCMCGMILDIQRQLDELQALINATNSSSESSTSLSPPPGSMTNTQSSQSRAIGTASSSSSLPSLDQTPHPFGVIEDDPLPSQQQQSFAPVPMALASSPPPPPYPTAKPLNNSIYTGLPNASGSFTPAPTRPTTSTTNTVISPTSPSLSAFSPVTTTVQRPLGTSAPLQSGTLEAQSTELRSEVTELRKEMEEVRTSLRQFMNETSGQWQRTTQQINTLCNQIARLQAHFPEQPVTPVSGPVSDIMGSTHDGTNPDSGDGEEDQVGR